MASTRRVKRAKPNAKTAKPAEIDTPLTIVPDYPPTFPTFYSNYVSVTHTSSEFFLDCCLMGMPYHVNLDEAQVTVPVIARIVLPPVVAVGLITALQSQKEKHDKTAKAGGTLRLPLPKPKSESEKQ